MVTVKIKYTEMEKATLTSKTNQFDDIDEAKSWAKDVYNNGFWHEHSQAKMVFIPQSDIHKVSIERG